MIDTMLMCSVFRCARHADMYLYVSREKGLGAVDDDLLNYFGRPVHVMDLLLRPDRRLAKADVRDVMSAIREKGFYLQLPDQWPEREVPDA